MILSLTPPIFGHFPDQPPYGVLTKPLLKRVHSSEIRRQGQDHAQIGDTIRGTGNVLSENPSGKIKSISEGLI